MGGAAGRPDLDGRCVFGCEHEPSEARFWRKLQLQILFSPVGLEPNGLKSSCEPSDRKVVSGAQSLRFHLRPWEDSVEPFL